MSIAKKTLSNMTEKNANLIIIDLYHSPADA